jgi:pimeloyl-ACP methyl ester carboxylesterase
LRAPITDVTTITTIEPALPELSAVAAADLAQEGWADWVLTQLGSTLDAAMLQAMRFVVDALMMPRPQDLPELQRSAELFRSGDLWSEPRRFFSFIDEPVAPRMLTIRRRRAIAGGTIVSRAFTTAYRPYPGMETDAAADSPLLVEHWKHEPGRPLATVVALHGFSMGYPRGDAFALFAAPCFRAGLDVALVTLPFHGARTPQDARFSGERFAVPHVARLNAAVRQAIYEIHMLVGWLREHRDAPVGLLGLSLGGYLSALMAGLTAGLDFVIPMVPPVCMGDLAWRFFAQSRHYRGGSSPPFSRDELRAVYRVHSPLTFARRVDKQRILIIAGRGDRIVPPDHPHALWRHWEEPDICWFSGSHLAPFRRERLLAAILAHVRRCAGGAAVSSTAARAPGSGTADPS